MKQIPNIFTLLNLFFGCLAIVVILQTGLTINNDANGEQIVEIPQKIYWASIFIAIAAVIDFLDGFVARLLKASSDMGKQLDSLADVVSFGVAPGMIAYEFLRVAYAQQTNGLEINQLLLMPAFLLPCAGAYRLARFNIDTTQSTGFKGVPIPAAGLLIASFPLMYWFTDKAWLIVLLRNKWLWYAVILSISYLMVSTLPMLALKFKEVTIKKLMPFIIVVVVSSISVFVLQWVAVPIGFVTYVIVSLVFNKKSVTSNQKL
ncbi:MAG: CDP-diacylglycerol--serine O-phosphatidyltransferase [Chitinophaga sp.]|nr:CDP-diacylglycerol--serine O-phosphatidyltransferase [Chitinophaga sp.]